MTVEEISRYAYRGGDMPDGMTQNEEILYWRLRHIYCKASAGEITAEQGARQKEMQVLYYKAKVLRSERVNEILRRYAGATERIDDGELAE